jgi:hypothetical protein
MCRDDPRTERPLSLFLLRGAEIYKYLNGLQIFKP